MQPATTKKRGPGYATAAAHRESRSTTTWFADLTDVQHKNNNNKTPATFTSTALRHAPFPSRFHSRFVASSFRFFYSSFLPCRPCRSKEEPNFISFNSPSIGSPRPLYPPTPPPPGRPFTNQRERTWTEINSPWAPHVGVLCTFFLSDVIKGSILFFLSPEVSVSFLGSTTMRRKPMYWTTMAVTMRFRGRRPVHFFLMTWPRS